MIPSLYPIVKLGANGLRIYDGSAIAACSLCKRSIETKPECAKHYAALRRKRNGYYQCPFGFTTRSFHFNGDHYAISGVVAFPRFNTDNEREKAKAYPDNKVSRAEVDSYIQFLRDIEKLRVDTIESAAKVLPQAMHELRKLNGAILQHAEKELQRSDTPHLLAIRSAAQLVKNDYDILEALSNIDTMKAVPLDDTINLFDLCYKTRSIFLERAASRHIVVDVKGVRAIVRGNQKSFPIVPAVLIENAIKYGRFNSAVNVNVTVMGRNVLLTVENQSDSPIDPVQCFEKGTRYAGSSVEGSGFGLFLAKEIVGAHGGTIQCEATEQVTRMIVTLPLVKVIDSIPM